ncbi:MAG: hypothetical protein WD688_02510 [Candidatus Binatia bacterium]
MSRLIPLWFFTLSNTYVRFAHRQWLFVTLIGFLAFAGCAAIGLIAGIPEPKTHDEFSYLLAADTFSHGRLTNPTHPMWKHFESFHIIHQPTYMSKYPPAQGLVLAAGQLLGHPILGVWMSFGLMCAGVCWMLYAWISPRWAVFGSILALINPVVGIAGYWAQAYWGGAIAATGGALVLGGIRRLMRRPCVYDSLLTGIGLAVLANSRPFEGLLISIPAVIFLLIHVIKNRQQTFWISIRRIVLPILCVLTLTATAMGFYNLGVTGNPLRMPYQVHEETYGIAPLFIWQDPLPEPKFNHQIIRDFHTTYAFPLYENQRSMMGFILAKRKLLYLLVVGALNIYAIPLIGMFTFVVSWVRENIWARRAVAIYLVFVLGLITETFMLLHYIAPVVALNYFFVLNALQLWRRHNRRVGELVCWLMPLLATVLLAKSLSGAIKQNRPSAWHMERSQVVKQLKQKDGKHLVIVSYGPNHSVHDEWVYNNADIDGAKVVFARHMDQTQDCKLAEYFRLRHLWSLDVDGVKPVPGLKPYPLKLCG